MAINTICLNKIYFRVALVYFIGKRTGGAVHYQQ